MHDLCHIEQHVTPYLVLVPHIQRVDQNRC